VDYKGYSKHLEMIQSGLAKIGAAKIWYSKLTKTYYLLVSMEVEVPDLTPSDIRMKPHVSAFLGTRNCGG
jgi:hypothetical protein